MSLKNVMFVVAIVMAGVGLVGCGTREKPGAAKAPATDKVASVGHSHDGWWCDEHGVPEEICTQCDLKLTADYKAKGDWCQKHDRAESQCFLCHPEKEAEFAADYEAKYGKKPPKVAKK